MRATRAAEPAPVDTLEAFKHRALAAIASANASHGHDGEVPGLRAAIEALPDRSLVERLPSEVRQFIEAALADIEGARS